VGQAFWSVGGRDREHRDCQQPEHRSDTSDDALCAWSADPFELGGEQAHAEPRDKRRWHDVRVQLPRPWGFRECGDERPTETQRAQRNDDAHAHRTVAPAERDRQQRHHEVESHLYTQGPQVREPAEQPVADVNLAQEQIRDHGQHARPAGNGEDQEYRYDRHPVGGHDPAHTFDVVSSDGAEVGGVGGQRERAVMTAPQQETRQGKEHRHEEIGAGHHAVEKGTVIGAGLESYVGDDDSAARDSAEAFERGEKPGAGGGGHENQRSA